MTSFDSRDRLRKISLFIVQPNGNLDAHSESGWADPSIAATSLGDIAQTFFSSYKLKVRRQVVKILALIVFWNTNFVLIEKHWLKPSQIQKEQLWFFSRNNFTKTGFFSDCLYFQYECLLALQNVTIIRSGMQYSNQQWITYIHQFSCSGATLFPRTPGPQVEFKSRHWIHCQRLRLEFKGF